MRLTSAATFAAFLALAAPALAEDADPVVAKVGDAEIHRSELNLAIQALDPQLAQLPEDQKTVAALSGAIDVKLFVKPAKDEKLDQTPDFKSRMSYLEGRELHNAYFRKHVVEAVTKEQEKARYDKEIAAMPKEEEVHARHILVKTEDEAKAIIADLDKGKDFAELAKEKSLDGSKSDGGDLGFFGHGRMVKPFEDAAFSTAPGTYTKTPVKSDFGYHVIKVEEKRVAPPPAFEQVEGQIRNLVMRDMYIDMLNKAKAATKIEVLDAKLKKGLDDANAQEQQQQQQQ